MTICLSVCLSLFLSIYLYIYLSLVAQSVKNPPSMQKDCLQHRRPGFNPWVRKIPWRRKWQPTPVDCLENPMDREAWWATTYAVTRVGHNLATKASSLKWHNIISLSSRYDTASGSLFLNLCSPFSHRILCP